MKPRARLKVVVDTDEGSEPVLFEEFYFENTEIRDKAYDYLEEHNSEIGCADEIWDAVEEFANENNVNYLTSNDEFDMPNKINTIEFIY